MGALKTMVMVQNKGKNNNQFANWLFQVGQRISMAIESGLIGILPLILFILEVLSAIAEASLVEQVMPYFEGTFIKAIVYTGIGMAAGIFLFPNISWWHQCNKFLAEVNADKMIPPAFKDKTLLNLLAARNRYGWTALFALLVAAGSHVITIYFMLTAFNNKETLRLLEIEKMGEVPMALAISVSVVAFGLDILLGLTTSTQLQLSTFFPSEEDKKSMMAAAEVFEHMQMEELRMHKELLELRKRRQEELAKMKEEYGNKDKKDKDKSKKEGNGGSPEKKDTNERKKQNSSNRDRYKGLDDIEKMDEFFEKFFQGKVRANDIIAKLESADEKDYQEKFAVPLAKCFNNLKGYIREYNDLGPNDNTRKLDGAIGSEKGKLIKLLRELGVKISK